MFQNHFEKTSMFNGTDMAFPGVGGGAFYKTTVNNSNNNSWHYSDGAVVATIVPQNGVALDSICSKDLLPVNANDTSYQQFGTAQETIETQAMEQDADQDDSETLKPPTVATSSAAVPSRPMNAFLMFCKKHRRIVSEHFPKKENRYHTKVLGEWWKQLSKEEKEPYESLAREHKAELYEAGYRWSRQGLEVIVPAPDAQMNLVQSNGIGEGTPETRVPEESNDTVDGNLEAARSLLALFNSSNQEEEELPAQPMTEFKLADETKMGALSTLMPQQPVTDGSTSVAIEQTKQIVDNRPCDMASDMVEPYQNMRQHYLSQTIPRSDHSLVNGGQSNGVVYSRAPRKVKGKLYEQYKQSQQLQAMQARRPSRSPPSSTVTTSDITPNITAQTVTAPKSPPKVPQAHAGVARREVVPTASEIARYGRAVQELQQKIKDLPPKRLEDYLAKKVVSKRHRLRHGSGNEKKPRATFLQRSHHQSALSAPVEVTAIPSIAAIEPVDFGEKPRISGCRKRKGLKEHIVRINSIQ
ncbi:transcription factor SOX-9 [Anopheles aquasalis]|uniref:transcription factor SOX-9 n=1 Tax=Anopheles aquasalis TaxID=42839 RepID=UPI00215B0F3D|nr:transcription factor SOX-9 [Anopheles aquasalis]XP_050086920.1 transcription factor SOX-9 [Anopheles aquasalis]